MAEIEKVNTMFHKFGHQLLDRGIKFIKTAYKLKPKVFTRPEILAFLNGQTGIPNSSISLADMKYHVETWAKWGQIIDLDLIDTQKYLTDVMDCDNFAMAYAARASMVYGLNTCGIAYGNIYDLTGKFIGRHAFNLIVTHEKGVLKLYCYEPMDDNSNQVIKGQKIILIHGWEYRPDWILMQ